MKHFIKTSLIVAVVWAVVVSMALSTSSCEHKPDVTPVVYAKFNRISNIINDYNKTKCHE